jgi:hypothetical protein
LFDYQGSSKSAKTVKIVRFRTQTESDFQENGTFCKKQVFSLFKWFVLLNRITFLKERIAVAKTGKKMKKMKKDPNFSKIEKFCKAYFFAKNIFKAFLQFRIFRILIYLL